jgi:hypothetical protein
LQWGEKQSCLYYRPGSVHPFGPCKRAREKDTIYALIQTLADDTRFFILRNQKIKLKNISSQRENIPSNLPKKVLEPMLNFEAPQIIPISRGVGGGKRGGLLLQKLILQ